VHSGQKNGGKGISFTGLYAPKRKQGISATRRRKGHVKGEQFVGYQ
jgi:hypothetical protein